MGCVHCEWRWLCWQKWSGYCFRERSRKTLRLLRRLYNSDSIQWLAPVVRACTHSGWHSKYVTLANSIFNIHGKDSLSKYLELDIQKLCVYTGLCRETCVSIDPLTDPISSVRLLTVPRVLGHVVKSFCICILPFTSHDAVPCHSFVALLPISPLLFRICSNTMRVSGDGVRTSGVLKSKGGHDICWFC